MKENFFSSFDALDLNKIDQTVTYLERLKDRPLVNYKMAMEADSIFPVLKYARESDFAEAFSSGGISALTENLGGGAIALIAAAVAAIGFGIYKLWRWMTKKEGEYEDTSSGTKIPSKSEPKTVADAQKLAQERLKYTEEKLSNIRKFLDKYNDFMRLADKPITIGEGTFNDTKIFNDLPRKYKGSRVSIDNDFLDNLAWAIYKEKQSSMPWKMLYGDIYRVPAIWLMFEGQSSINPLLTNLRKIASRFAGIFENISEIFNDKVFEYKDKITADDVTRIKNRVAKMDDNLFVDKKDGRKITDLTKEMNEVADVISSKNREKSSIIRRLLGGSKYKEKKYKLSYVGGVLSSSTYISTYEELTRIIATDDNSIYTCTFTANEMFEKLQKSINDFAVSEKHKKHVKDHGSAQASLLGELKQLLTTVRLIVSNQTDFFVMVNSFRLDLERMNRAFEEAGKVTVSIALSACRISKEKFNT